MRLKKAIRLTALSATLLSSATAWSGSLARSPEGTSGLISYGAMSYVGSSQSSAPIDAAGPSFSLLQARLSTSSRGKVFEGVLSAEGLVGVTTSKYRGIEAHEAYLGTSHALSPIQLSIGRKLEGWSRLDDEWKLGLWQPQFEWDFLNPVQVGLTGAFLRYEGQGLRIVAFGSPISIPSRGSPVALQGGVFSSELPGFGLPDSVGNLFGKDTDIRYKLHLPPTSRLIMNPSTSLSVRLGQPQGLWASAAAGYKPMNQLLLGISGSQNLASRQVDADLYPRLAYHRLLSIEGGFLADAWQSWVSVLKEDPASSPVSDPLPSGLTLQEVSPALSLSAGFGVRLAGTSARPTQVGLSYLRRIGGDAPDQGPLASPGVSKFDSRYRFETALGVGLITPLPGSFGSRWDTQSKVTFDLKNRGQIFSEDVRYHFVDAWTLAVGADVLGAEQNPSDHTNDDFIVRNRANDRFYAGVSYAF